VGFNPLRRYRGQKTTDITIFVVTSILLAVLIVWAMK